MRTPVAFELAPRAPSPRMAGLICGMTCYRETTRGRFRQREAASLVVPLIISLRINGCAANRKGGSS
jgi:hypothetical protein